MTQPTTAAGRALLDIGWRSYDHFRESILSIEREARATSASVPPLDMERLRQAMFDHARRTHGLSMDCDEECAPDIAATYDAAETPEQGRGDEPR